MTEARDPRTSSASGEGREPVFALLRGPVATLSSSFHMAFDTQDARRLRADPELVRIPGFLLLDTADYEPVLGLVPLHLYWRMQGMDILAHMRSANRARRARPGSLPLFGSVWLVEATLDDRRPQDVADPLSSQARGGPPCLRISALHALDRVSIERCGPRYIESIDTRVMLPRFTNQAQG